MPVSFAFGAVLFVGNATAPFSDWRRWGQPQGDLGLPAFFVSADRWAFGPRDVVLVDEGIRASGEGRTTSGPPPAHRSQNRAGKNKTVRLAREIIL